MQKSSTWKTGVGLVQIDHLVEFLCAAHVGQQVESPWEDRGGIVLVAEPEQLKTTIAAVLGAYPNARLLSDVNVTELANLRGDMVSNKYKTLVFLDFQKVYERNSDSASNIEGVLRALTGEGWQGLAHEAQVTGMPGRTFAILCITPKMYKRKGLHWKDSGFARRFLWLQYALSNPEVKIAAMNRWEKVPIGDVRIPWPVVKIPMRNTETEAEMLRAMVVEQPGAVTNDIQFQVLSKAYAVLKHHYKARRGEAKNTPIQIMQGMQSLLSRHGGELVLSGPQLVRKPNRMEGIS